MKNLKLSLPCAIAIATLSVSANAADIVLNKGESITMSGVQGSQTFYSFNTPANVDSVSFYMAGGTGDADLIVKFGSKPTQSTYDCRYLSSSNDEHCLFDWGRAQTGTYYVMIRGYDDYADASLVADYSLLDTPPTSDSGTVANVDIYYRKWAYETIDVPDGVTTLSAAITGGSGDADLYLNHQTAPTRNRFDCRPYLWGNEESCTINAPASGQWHIGVRAYSTVEDVTINWSYE